MINTIDALSRLLESTPLAGRQTAELAVLNSGELAFAVRIGPDELETAWRSARGLLESTGRWPVAVSIPATCTSWQESPVDEDLFNRFFYEEAENTADISPQGVLAAAAKAIRSSDVSGYPPERGVRDQPGSFDGRRLSAFPPTCDFSRAPLPHRQRQAGFRAAFGTVA